MIVRQFTEALQKLLGAPFAGAVFFGSGRFRLFKTQKAKAEFVCKILEEGVHFLHLDFNLGIHLSMYLTEKLFNGAKYGVICRRMADEFGEDICFYTAEDDETLEDLKRFHAKSKDIKIVMHYNTETDTYHFYDS